jgi:hypothetical protein
MCRCPLDTVLGYCPAGMRMLGRPQLVYDERYPVYIFFFFVLDLDGLNDFLHHLDPGQALNVELLENKPPPHPYHPNP